MRSMRLKKVLPILLAAVMLGCGSDKPQPTQKAKVTEQWNVARADVLGSLATEQYNGGNIEKARESINKAITLYPKSARFHVVSAKIAMEQGQLEQAEKELRLAQLMDPKIAEADYLCGVVYERWQKPQVAFELYQSASFKAPEEIAYVMASAEMLVAMNRQADALDLLKGKADSFEHSGTL